MNARLSTLHAPLSQASSPSKAELLETLRTLLGASLRHKGEGANYAKHAHAQGCADGFMRALTQMGIVSDRELLSVIQDARKGLNGPSTAVLQEDTSSARPLFG